MYGIKLFTECDCICDFDVQLSYGSCLYSLCMFTHVVTNNHTDNHVWGSRWDYLYILYFLHCCIIARGYVTMIYFLWGYVTVMFSIWGYVTLPGSSGSSYGPPLATVYRGRSFSSKHSAVPRAFKKRLHANR